MEKSGCPNTPPIRLNPDLFPDFLPIEHVAVLTGRSVAMIRFLASKEQFPQPIRYSTKKQFWRKADVLQFLSLQGNGGRGHE